MGNQPLVLGQLCRCTVWGFHPFISIPVFLFHKLQFVLDGGLVQLMRDLRTDFTSGNHGQFQWHAVILMEVLRELCQD